MLVIHGPIETKPAQTEQEFYEIHGNASAVLFYRLLNAFSGPSSRRSFLGGNRQSREDCAADLVRKRQIAP
jgi:hypothetical protein